MAGIPGAGPTEQALWDLLGAQLRALRKANGMTLAQVGEQCHMSGSLISKVEGGARRLPADSVEPLEKLFSAQGTIRAAWLAIGRTANKSDDGGISAIAAVGNADGMDQIRRGILTGAAAIAAGTVLGGDGFASLRELVDARLGTSSLPDWEERVWETAAGYATAAELPTLAATIALDLLATQALADKAPPGEALGWARVNARLTFLLAYTLGYCVGRTPEVRRWWNTACRAAERTGDATLISAAHAYQANQAIAERNDRLIASHAEAALRAAQGRALPAAAEAFGTLAQLKASAGDADAALAQLDEQKRALSRLPAETRANPILLDGWPEVRHTQMASSTFIRLGHPDADKAVNDLISELPQAQGRGRLAVQIAEAKLQLAYVEVRKGDARSGLAQALEVVNAMETYTSSPYIRRTALDVLDLAPGLDEAEELRDRLALPMGTSAS
ncbi:Helix-turn-helix domain-containing protein [Sinosporangium album]|uniref:Helix-turn-helix domain-containing protein n=2 Tax=Sinosporangium album TaxID=504805 RepID=A0A1G8IAM2_9ACTN|nr:Helix-turn-helix domain-containing protein [Sinosporangium album]